MVRCVYIPLLLCCGHVSAAHLLHVQYVPLYRQFDRVMLCVGNDNDSYLLLGDRVQCSLPPLVAEMLHRRTSHTLLQIGRRLSGRW